MKHTKNIILITGLIILNIVAFSQETEVHYNYDASGNRMERQIITLPAQLGDFNLDSLMVEEEILDYKVSIFPNPTRGGLKVLIAGEIDFEQSSISVFSMDGTLIYKKEPVEESNYIDLLSQAPGMYIMRLLIEGKLEAWKILKQ